MAVLYCDPLFCEHKTGMHPESPDRIRALLAMLHDSGLDQKFIGGAIAAADPNVLARIHPREYARRIEQFAAAGGGRIEADTVVSPSSYEVAVKAAGCAVAAVDDVLGRGERAAAALIRPPGHHALRAKAMGFCLFNNVCVAAKHAVAEHGLERVLIVDWDVHHGNGTQDIFYEDGCVHFFSAHRYPFYPGTGSAEETGRGRGLGATWNLPLPFGIAPEEYRDRFRAILDEAAKKCRPQLVLISAGFDAHRDDPIGSLGLGAEDFALLTDDVCGVAGEYCGGRIVSLLEGGYNLDALAASVRQHLERLLAHEAKMDE